MADAPGNKSAKAATRVSLPPIWLAPFHPGMRVAVAASGGADSTALLCALGTMNDARVGTSPGLVLSVAHMHHGIRGTAADADAAFVEELADRLGFRFYRHNVDTPATAGRDGIGLEEAARRLRYAWFADLLSSGVVDAVATAHTLNDQAETVLHRLLRGAWTEGLAGIHPTLQPGSPANVAQAGRILRPLLGATREQVITWLNAIGQPWREDATNADLKYTRNRIRHQLLPHLATFNPRIAPQLAHMATTAQEEEAYWQKEVDRLLPGLLLPGRPVRGGGRASSTMPGERSLAIEVERLRGLHPAVVRRLLRAAARQLGVALDFEQTARLVALVEGSASAHSRREELTGELRAERTPRELRLLAVSVSKQNSPATTRATAIRIPIPGMGEGFGWRLRCSLTEAAPAALAAALAADTPELDAAMLRAALPSDRVQLRYSRGQPKRVKEVLERMGVPASDRVGWPVLVWRGEIVWMAGAAVESAATSLPFSIEAEPLG